MKRILCALVFVVCPLSAETLPRLNLAEMVGRADRIFSGVVVTADEGSVAVGRRNLAVITYRVRIEDAIDGEFETLKGVRYARFTMLNPSPSNAAAGVRPASGSVPRLSVGDRYLLLTTPAGRLGLSSTVGLSQGCFRIRGEGATGEASNGVGTMRLSQLQKRIREEKDRKGRKP